MSSPQQVFIIKGSARTYLLTVLDERGNKRDLTGCIIKMTVRIALDDTSTVIFTKISTDNSQIAILDQTVIATKGQANIFILPEDTSGLSPKQYYYDIWVTLADNNPYPVVVPNIFEVKPRITVAS